MFCTLNTVTYLLMEWLIQSVSQVLFSSLLSSIRHIAMSITIAYLPHRVWLCLAISPCCSGGGVARSDWNISSCVHVPAIDRQSISHAQGHTCCSTTVIKTCCQPSVKCIVSMDPYLPQHCYTGVWCGLPSSFSSLWCHMDLKRCAVSGERQVSFQ